MSVVGWTLAAVPAAAARRNFVYRQEQTIRMRRPNGKLAREQQAEYTVAPGTPGRDTSKGLDLDGSLIQDFAGDMMDYQKARDGIGIDLFPLTAQEQQKCQFRLVRQEIYRGRQAYRVAFVPRRDAPSDEDHPLWKSEAVIDAAELQLVTVLTSMAEKVPMWARVLFGTDIKGLGFRSTTIFYRRSISAALVNRDFKRTGVQSTLVYAADEH